jgi:ankyrin repeat protein
MNLKVKTLTWWIASLVSVATLAAAAGDLRLVEAVRNKDVNAVRRLLKERVDVNIPRGDGSTALAWAAHWDDLETAELLIRAGANVNAASDSGATALWEACNNASAAMVEKLSKAGANPNAILSGNGETALMRCARTGNADAVRSLLARGADVNAKEPAHGQTALMWALSESHAEAARALVEHGADIHAKSKGGFTPFLFAAQQADVESAEILLRAGADVNEATPGGLNALLVAIDSGHEEFAIFLVEHGANPNSADRDGLTALHYSLRKGWTYLKGGERDDRYGAISLSYMFRPTMPALVNALLEHGANPNARILKGGKKSQLHTSELLKIGVAGATPFLLAAASGDGGIMQALLAKGADPKLATNDGVTPLMAAAGVGFSGGASGDRTKEEEKGALEAVKLMVELGADVNAVSTEGWRAVHGAAYTGAEEILQFLVDKGAKLDVKNEWGQTPLSIAEGDPNLLVDAFEQRLHERTAELIRKLGGDPLAAWRQETLTRQ